MQSDISLSGSYGFQPAKWIKEGNYLQLDQSGKFAKIKDIEWFTDPKQAQQFLECIVNLVSYNNIYISASFQMLVCSFVPKESESGEIDTATVDQISRAVHVTIRRILELVPLSAKLLLDAVKSNYPYMMKSSPVLCCYLKNVLLITQYCPTILPPLLHVVFEKLLRIDVEIKLEDKEETNTMIFDEEIEQREMTQDQVLANKLDNLMLIMFDYLDSTFGIDQRSERDKQHPMIQTSLSLLPPSSFMHMKPSAVQQEGVFTVILEIFDTVILPTYKSKYIQFLVFYLCRLNRHTGDGLLADMFLAYLLNKLMNTHEPIHLRLSCSSYFGSFVARAKYLSTKSVSLYLHSIQTWLMAYLESHNAQSQQQLPQQTQQQQLTQLTTSNGINNNNNNTNNTIKQHTTPDAQANSLFYLMAQALFYIFCFHHEELLQQNLLPTGFSAACRTICQSDLNPLKVCLPAVVQEFARLATNKAWFDAEAIVSVNSKIVMATVSSWGGGLSNQLESYFPFDPYLLKDSARYIQELYMEWRGEEEESDSDSIDADDYSDNEVDELNKDFMSLSTPVEDKNVHFRLAFSP